MFIDFYNVYDIIHSLRLYNILRKYGVPKKLISMVRACTAIARAKLKYQGGLFRESDIQTGLLQGDTMLSVIFNILLKKVMREMNRERKCMNLNGRIDLLLVYAMSS